MFLHTVQNNSWRIFPIWGNFTGDFDRQKTKVDQELPCLWTPSAAALPIYSLGLPLMHFCELLQVLSGTVYIAFVGM